ncbi:hypothetical protein HPB50_014376 [Hyalomma asiaticum]|uniref:Uncharacterized protein n=1 Tax=Hyalomma asiaticum TaxID=266040 RepID=A0ACB7RNL4_HYAAI|nr:hypothetical protein HPB50_014376 [Hyalomma asiaticum]
MPPDDTMIPAWFKMADSLLKMLEVPEEMQCALILPFLTEEVKRSVVSESLSGTCSYGELKEKVLKDLKLTPTEYRRCYLEIEKEVREQSCDSTKLTGSFGKAIIADVRYVPLGLPCPSGNTLRVSLPCALTPESTTSADVLLTPGDHESPCLAMSLSGPKPEGSVCSLVERPAEQEVILANGNGVDTATPFCDEDIARDAVGEELNREGEGNMWLEATLEPPHESEEAVDIEISEQVEADPASDDRERASVAKVGTAGNPAQKVIGHCPEEDGDQRRLAVLSMGHAPTREKDSAAERGSFAMGWTKETFGRWIFRIKVRIKTHDDLLPFLTRSAPRSAFPRGYV